MVVVSLCRPRRRRAKGSCCFIMCSGYASHAAKMRPFFKLVDNLWVNLRPYGPTVLFRYKGCSNPSMSAQELNVRSIVASATDSFIFDLMNKARRHELKMLHYKKRMKKMRHVYPDGNYFAYRSHSTPCSCGCCRGDRYSRAKEMEEARKLAEPISEHGSL